MESEKETLRNELIQNLNALAEKESSSMSTSEKSYLATSQTKMSERCSYSPRSEKGPHTTAIDTTYGFTAETLYDKQRFYHEVEVKSLESNMFALEVGID